MKSTSITLSMSSDPAPDVVHTEKTRLQLPPSAWLFVLTLAAGAGGAWISVRGDVTRQGAAIEANRVENERKIADLRAEIKEQLGNVTVEQKSQRELLIRIDENIKRLPR